MIDPLCGRDHDEDRRRADVLRDAMGPSPFGTLLRLEDAGWRLEPIPDNQPT